MFDLVIVVHNDHNKLLAIDLIQDIHNWLNQNCDLFIEDNSGENNIGFAAACNIGASKGSHEIIGFINPDAIIYGDFMTPVLNIFKDKDVMITGGNFNKNKVEVEGWGCADWVCGAAMFVRRSFWEEVGGFDERFVWSYEETDLIRRCESMGYKCRSLSPVDLPIQHSSPSEDTDEDKIYKTYWMAESGRRFWEKWNG